MPHFVPQGLNIVFLKTVSEVICKQKDEGCFGLAETNVIQVQQDPLSPDPLLLTAELAQCLGCVWGPLLFLPALSICFCHTGCFLALQWWNGVRIAVSPQLWGRKTGSLKLAFLALLPLKLSLWCEAEKYSLCGSVFSFINWIFSFFLSITGSCVFILPVETWLICRLVPSLQDCRGICIFYLRTRCLAVTAVRPGYFPQEAGQLSVASALIPK